MLWTPAGGGIVLLLSMAILGFGHGLHLEMVKPSLKRDDGSVNLVRHKREWIIPPVSIYEEQDNSFKNPIAKIQSDSKVDPSLRIRYKITGRGVTEPPLGMFIINERTGEMNVTGIVDREEIPMFYLKGYALDQYGKDVEPPIDLRVKVIDINDNSPVFTQEVFVGTVEELSPSNTLIMFLNATDADEPNTINSKLAYRILSQEGQSQTFMVTKSGEVRTIVATLDREKQSSYNLEVQVRDRDGDPNGGLAGTASLKIKVKDVNDNIPRLENEQYEGSVEENVANVEILRMKVFDDDEEFTDNWLANFTIVSGNEDHYFEIITDTHTNEGVLMLVKEADYEVMQNVLLSVIVSNRAEYHSSIRHMISSGGTIIGGGGGGGGGGGAGGAGGGGGKAVPIKVKVKNVREGPVFKPRRKILAVSEGKTVINKVIGTYQAYDADTGGIAQHVKYAKEYDPDNWFTIDQTTAEIKLIKMPDRESIYVVNGTYIAKILAISEDLPGKTATGTIAIDVEDVNDNCPVLVNPDQTVCEDSKFINLTAVDRDAFPNGAPLKFMVVDEPPGNAKLWSIGKTDSESAQLIPKDIWVGLHQVQILVTDNKGMSCPEKQILKLTVCTCEKGISGCTERLSDTSIGLGGGAVGLMILACLLLLLVPLLLLLCFCGSEGKGFLAVPAGTEESILVHNHEGASPEDTAVLSHMTAIGFAGAGAGGGAGAGAGMIKGDGYGMQEGYDYNSKGMYNSNTLLERRYEENRGLFTAAEMAAGAGSGMRSIGVLGSGGGSGTGGQVSFAGAGSQAALNEGFLKGYFYDKVMACADEDLAQAAKDCILIYSKEGSDSIAGSVGCCSLIESDFEENYLDDLGMKFKVLADICQGTSVNNVQISKYNSHDELRQDALDSEAIMYAGVTQNVAPVEDHRYAVESSYTLSESQRLEHETVPVGNVVAEESFVSSRYVQEPIMRGNMLVTEKSYTTGPAVILEPIHQQNVLVTERVIRPATSLHNILDISNGENVMVTERVLKSDQGLVGIGEPLDSQYVMVTERRLGPTSNVKAAVGVSDFSRGQNVLVTERHYTPVSAINGNVMIPAELSGGQSIESISILDGGGQGYTHYNKGGYLVEELQPSRNNVGKSTNIVKENISILDGGVQGHYKQGGYLVEELQPSGNNVAKSTNRVTKYSTVQYTRS
ncbi:desmoglein-2 [Mixophyes fleayi]|uniref:desmoglein-2 n=1 Tax=Mixophyes fleayi TaxID=3061075 RepID=UPI003F4DF8ED